MRYGAVGSAVASYAKGRWFKSICRNQLQDRRRPRMRRRTGLVAAVGIRPVGAAQITRGGKLRDATQSIDGRAG